MGSLKEALAYVATPLEARATQAPHDGHLNHHGHGETAKPPGGWGFGDKQLAGALAAPRVMLR